MEIEQLWSGWKIDKFIGEGSFGKVYKIVREDFGHTYEAALKVIHIPQNQSEVDTIRNEGMNENSVTMYFRSMVEEIVEEFALMSKLKGNSNIVSYEDHAVIPCENAFGWEIYIRMELLTPLFEYLKNHTMSVREVIQLGVDMCQALEVCQKYNIIHRDIKPENIFVSDLGKFKLGDFGIARQLEKTSSGLSKKGTYTYMAPEVYKGLQYNSTVDIYSLGIVLYRFLNNNRAPFMPPYPNPIRYSDKENANILRMSGKAMPNPCNARGRLAEIILKACAYDANQRYESAYEMRQALQSVLYSDEEADIIYPSGDKVLNDDNEYVVSDKSEKKNIESKSFSSDKGEGTVYLFRLSDREKAEIEAQKREKLLEEECRRRELEEKQRQEAEEKARREAEERARQEAEEKARRKAEERAQQEAEEKARRLAEEKAHQEAKEKDVQSETQGTVKENVSSKKKMVIPIIAAAACIGIIIGVFGYQNSQKRTVPSVTNMTIAEAEKLLEENDLLLTETDKTYSDTVAAGCIISQDQDDGQSVKKNTEIGVVVSLGALKTVPDLVNLSQKDAEESLVSAGLRLEGIEETFSDTVQSGMIVSQNPAAGSEIGEGATVAIVLSKGSEPTSVPSVEGMTSKEAKQALKAASLTYKVNKEYSDSVKAGNVIKQSVAAGEVVKKNTSVVLTVSRGKKPEPASSENKNSSNTSSNSGSGSSSGGSSSGSSNSSSSSSGSQKSSSSSKKKSEGEDIDSWGTVNEGEDVDSWDVVN